MEIRFGEIYAVTTKVAKVTREGRDRIHWRLQDECCAEETHQTLPEDWDWDWMIQEGEFRGRLPKRIASFFKKQYDIKLSSDTITYLGNVAKRYSHVAKTYTFDFTKCFDWMSGDFGDSGSCFWGGRNPAREVLMLNGVIAIRFYREDGQTGFARAWIAVLDKGLVVFNAYGLPCATIAYVLSTLFNAPPSRGVIIYLAGDLDDLIYLNGDARVVGLDVRSIALKFDVPYKLCGSCDEFVHKDDFSEDSSRCNDCWEFLNAS